MVASAALPLAALLLAMKVGAQGGAWPAPGSDPGHVGFCIVNVGATAVFTGKAGLAINAAVKTCPVQDTAVDKKSCTVSITGVILSFGYMSALASAAAADCMSTLTLTDKAAVTRAECAADTSDLIAGLTLVASAGTAVAITCGKTKALAPEEWLAVGAQFRRLSGLDPEQEKLTELGRNHTEASRRLDIATRNLQKKGAFPRPIAALKAAMDRAKDKQAARKDRPAAQAECAINVGQITWFLARASLQLHAAITDCSAAELYRGKHKNQAKCMAEIIRVIESLGVVGAGIANAVDLCPELLRNVEAACAGSIIYIIVGLSDALSASASFENSCKELKGGRRLMNSTETSASEHLV